jgi:hypothetical protein
MFSHRFLGKIKRLGEASNSLLIYHNSLLGYLFCEFGYLPFQVVYFPLLFGYPGTLSKDIAVRNIRGTKADISGKKYFIPLNK